MLSTLAVALTVSTDSLVFDTDERGPGDDLRLAFEGTQRLDPDERTTIRQLIEAMLLGKRASGPPDARKRCGATENNGNYESNGQRQQLSQDTGPRSTGRLSRSVARTLVTDGPTQTVMQPGE